MAKKPNPRKIRREKRRAKVREIREKLAELRREFVRSLHFSRLKAYKYLLSLVSEGKLKLIRTGWGLKIFYNKAYEEYINSYFSEAYRRATSVLRRGEKTPDGTAAKHDIYRIPIEPKKPAFPGKITILKKAYIDTPYRVDVALQEACSLLEAKRRGISVPDFVAVEINPSQNKAALITSYNPSFKTLASVKSTLSSAPARSFLPALGEFIGNMHRKGLYHTDLDLENILWNASLMDPKFMLIDFEGAKFFKTQPKFSTVHRDLGVLFESLAEPPLGVYSRRDIERYFVPAYCKVTGYNPNEVKALLESVFPAQPGQRERDAIRKRIEP